MIEEIGKFIQEAQDKLSQKTELHKRCGEDLKIYLEQLFLDSPFHNIIVQTRVKSEASLKEKVYRNNYFQKHETSEKFVEELKDIIGARIVCLLNSDEEKIYLFLQDKFTCTEDGGQFKYSEAEEGKVKLYLELSGQPQKQKNGHEIYRITCRWFHEESGTFINVELQIKSLVHFFWGELDHMLFYKNYTYLISNTFYKQLMEKINSELKNIDDQLLNLKDQIDKTNDKEVQEIRQIASLILYNKYKSDVEKALDCTIDLREIFDLVVDIYFKNTGDKQQNYRKLNELIANIDSKKFDFNLIKLISVEKLKEAEIPPKVKLFAYQIDNMLKSKDIFWAFFFLIYSAHFVKNEDQNYTHIVRSISEDFMKMTSGFEDELERLEDDCEWLYDNYLDAIYVGIAKAFENIKKLRFFIYKTNLNVTNEITKNMVWSYQHKIKPDPEAMEIIQRNLKTISLLVKCKIIVASEKTIKKEEIIVLKNLLEQEDCFDINFNYAYFEENIKHLDVISLNHFTKLFAKEGN